jgi:hypothetical protein
MNTAVEAPINQHEEGMASVKELRPRKGVKDLPAALVSETIT